MGTLEGKVAIVTGGANGIGAAVSRIFAAQGAAVVVNDYGVTPDGQGSDATAAEAIAAEITANGGTATAVHGDIGDTAVGRQLVDTAVSAHGRLDIVVNTAGFLRDRMIFNLTEEDWDAVVRVHLKGHYSTIQPAAAYWRGQRNPDADYRIVNFTSRSALDGSPGQPNYAAAKLGVVGFTYSLAQALGRYGVTANAISPSSASRMVNTVPEGKKFDKPADDHPERSPDNVARLALYLASERSRWLTGRVLHASGFDVGLYHNPEIIRQVSNTAPWEQDRLADSLEKVFRPVADGLPASVFSVQKPS